MWSSRLLVRKGVRFRTPTTLEPGTSPGIINFEQGVKVTGSRFYVLSGVGARLQRALIAFMLDLHTRQGYTEKYTPFMVKGACFMGLVSCPSLLITCIAITKKTCGWCQPLRCR